LSFLTQFFSKGSRKLTRPVHQFFRICGHQFFAPRAFACGSFREWPEAVEPHFLQSDASECRAATFQTQVVVGFASTQIEHISAQKYLSKLW
jgi:hypothetical protein